MCQLLGPFAWAYCNRVVREIDAAPNRYGNRGSVVVGRAMAVVASVMVALAVLLVVSLVTVALLGESSAETDVSRLGRLLPEALAGP